MTSSTLSTDIDATKAIVTGYLRRSHFQLEPTHPDHELRRQVAAAAAEWQLSNGDPEVLRHAQLTGCIIAERAYSHISPRGRYYVALYTACFVYIDDVDTVYAADPAARAAASDAVARFGQRFVAGERHPDGALRCLDGLLRDAYAYWPPHGALAIALGSIDSVDAMYLEYVQADTKMRCPPSAARYMLSHRLRTGVAPPYAHFNFEKGCSVSGSTYLQAIPEISLWIVLTNDILSFYKEEQAGETENYVHLCATAQQRPPMEMLRGLVEEALDATRKIEDIVSDDQGARFAWRRFKQGYMEFHVNTPRYRLGELGVCALSEVASAQ